MEALTTGGQHHDFIFKKVRKKIVLSVYNMLGNLWHVVRCFRLVFHSCFFFFLCFGMAGKVGCQPLWGLSLLEAEIQNLLSYAMVFLAQYFILAQLQV